MNLSEHSLNTLIWIAAAVCAAALSIKYFPGLESSHYYAGFVIDAIHPELLDKDPIVGGDLSMKASPYKLTLYYLLPRIFGEIWLDDRFIAVFYILTVAVSFGLVDKLGVALGAQGLAERLFILLMFLKDHVILENAVNLAHQPDFHHSALAIPVSLWVLWAAVRGKSLWIVFALSALAASVSVQIAPGTIAMALLARAAVGTLRERMVIAAVLAAGIAAAYIVMFRFLEVPAADGPVLWNLFVYDWYEGMVLPFDPRFEGMAATVFGNAAFAFIFGAALLWPAAQRGGARRALKAVRIILVASLAAWLVLGLYVQFAPESMQYPQLLIFPVTRQLQSPQIIAYVALMVLVFRWLDAERTPNRLAAATAVLFVLYIAGPGNFGKWAGLLAAASVFSVALVWFVYRHGIPRLPVMAPAVGRAGFIPDTYMTLAAVALAATMAVAMAVGAWQKFPAWVHLARTGIHGASENALWMRVPEYLRANTPQDAVVLPLRWASAQTSDPGGGPGDVLVVKRSVASRSGRAVPYPMMFSHGLDLKRFKLAREQRNIASRITAALSKGDAATAAVAIDALRPRPGYLVVPDDVAGRIANGPLPFTPQANVGGFAVLRRTGQTDGAGTSGRP